LFNRTVQISEDHETVLIILNDESFEVTTFRSNNNNQQRSIEEDLTLRDFTINALAMDEKGHVIDIISGTQDLNEKVIRLVNNDEQRLLEDPLRIIRALRFQGELGFIIDRETLEQIKQLKTNLQDVAVERLLTECERLFASPFYQQAITTLKETGVHTHLPIFHENPSLINPLLQLNKRLASFDELIAYLSINNDQVSITDWCRAWKCSKETKARSKEIVWAIDFFKENGLDEWLIYSLRSELYDSFIRVVSALEIEQSITRNDVISISDRLPIQSRQQLKIDGSDLIQLFPTYRRGRWIEESLRTLEKGVLYGKITNEHNTLKEWILCHPPVND